jgi:pimeloyl-ACP methyl ester carboxylesterase
MDTQAGGYKVKAFRACKLAFLLLLVLLTACSAPAPTSQPPTPTPMPSGMVDVGGYELFYQCSGQGSPTVILESGMGSDSSFWARVIAGVAKTTRVCAYDRANLGRSDEALTPRTFQDAARDLHARLGNARIGGPYILVGHSLGGELVHIFADQYPEEVAGIVLVDAAHPDMGPRLLAGLPQNRRMSQKT